MSVVKPAAAPSGQPKGPGWSLALLALALTLGLAWRASPSQRSWAEVLALALGVAAVLLLMVKLPRWFKTAPAPGAEALTQEKAHALGQLEESETRMGILVEEIKEYAIFQLDAQGFVTSWNPGAERVQGWPAPEILGQSHAVFYPPEDVLAGTPERDLAQARRQGSVHREAWRVRKDGTRYLAFMVITVLRTDGGVTGFSKVTHDLTLRWEAEVRLQALARDLETQMATRTAELQESEARLQGFIRHATVAIAFKGLDGRLLLANRLAEARIALWQANGPPTEAGAAYLDTFPPEVVARIRKEDERVITKREAIQTEEAVPLPDGGTQHFLVQRFPLLDTVGHCWGVGVIATDITERKRAEQADLQHQKLESVGLLAGGIAHDFNNLLGALSGNLELARLEPEEGALQAHLGAMEALIQRASGLVAQILAYAGKGKVQVQTLDLNREVEELTRLLRGALARNAALRWEPAPGLPPLEGDPAQIQQVILNLVLNASEALPAEGGLISIRTGLAPLSLTDLEARYPGEALKPGPHLILEVADNGVGISPQVREKIFDPFFTTKFTGRGLGLSAVQGILRSHAGAIQVESREGLGTTFRVLLPALAAPMAPLGTQPRAAAGFPAYRSWGTVLVVDDEDAMRGVAGSALCHMGFQVLEARDGLEALQAFQAEQGGIRLVLMDLAMPRMDGEEAFRELRRAGARMPIIISSGFGGEDVLRRFKGKGLAGFLQKPYRLKALVDLIRSALGEDAIDPNPIHPGVSWCPEFESGHPLLDAQHRALVERFNHLVAAVQGGEPSAPEEALHDLIGATVAHFGIEEGLMEDGAYPGILNHKEVHANLTRQVQELAQDVHRGAVAFGQPLLKFLEAWLLCHVQFEDRHLIRFLNER